ncbi:MAG: type II toxin-antitoxin system HicB family antitoxin [Lachnospiraceae bacterium]|nr:type II toxin-antitoxin system HicB family antitoxin [Lachnospiraceae bacterium]
MPKYSIVLQYDEADDIYVAIVPELKGCMAHGKTQADAVREINIAMELMVESMLEDGEELPRPLTQNSKIA